MSASRQELFSPAVNRKADQVPEGYVVPHESDESVFHVTSPRTGTAHRVQFISGSGQEWITCTCQHGGVRMGGARCYHASAAVRAREGL